MGWVGVLLGTVCGLCKAWWFKFKVGTAVEAFEVCFP